MLFAGCTSSNSEGEIPNDESDNKLVTEELPTEPAHKTEVPDGYVGIHKNHTQRKLYSDVGYRLFQYKGLGQS